MGLERDPWHLVGSPDEGWCGPNAADIIPEGTAAGAPQHVWDDPDTPTHIHSSCSLSQVCALRVTGRARTRILKAGGKILTFDQLALDSPKGCGTVLLSGEWGDRGDS